MIRALIMVLFMFSTPAYAEKLTLAVTTSFENSGLADVLIPILEEDTGIEVQLLVVGTGQALRLGEAGDVDAVLVHARAAEEAFVAAGHATHRREIMYNDFVLVGPRSDPARIGAALTASDALRAIAMIEHDFVSRGDNSGTHQAEGKLWAASGLDPAQFGLWYKQTGSGMGAALNTAAGLDAYSLADRASWINFGNKAGLALLFEGDPALFNQYSYMRVNSARHGHVKAEASAALEAWLTSERAATLINAYQVDGQQLFHFNATAQ